jgi:hypothetical protein
LCCTALRVSIGVVEIPMLSFRFTAGGFLVGWASSLR